MKILFCTPAPLTKELGAAKVVLELAEEMRLIGWDCQMLCPTDFVAPDGSPSAMQDFPTNLREYLKTHADEYDVVDYDHEYLPFPRTEFSPRPLFVARSVLLAHHLETIPIPTGRGIKPKIGALVKGVARRRARQERICRAQATIEAADLVNVSNDDDKAELVRRGVAPEKIVVVPYGISRARRPLFDAVPSAPPEQPTVAFVGTFDYRKGAREFPKIVQTVVDAVPQVRFRLLGTKGLYRTECEVLSHFPKLLRGSIEVTLKFRPEELPGLLFACSVGVFPSYVEGMPFGVLEMLAASVPVVAYDAPGPPMMLPAEYLVPRGDAAALGRTVSRLLHDAAALARARQWARERSQAFSWHNAARRTDEVYRAWVSARH